MMFQSFKFMVKITGKYICESKNWMLIFSHAPKQNSAASFYHYSPPRQKEITHSSWTAFSQDLYFLGKKGGEDYGVEKITKIKPTRLSFDKFHHLCNLYIFGFCFVVP